MVRVRRGSAFDSSVAVRMIFSCLMDTDYRDTEAFCARPEGGPPDREWPGLPDVLPELTQAFAAKIPGFAPGTPLNRRRASILSQLRAQAGQAPGLFTLSVPTGGDKTLASIGFALDHARQHARAALRQLRVRIPLLRRRRRR